MAILGIALTSCKKDKDKPCYQLNAYSQGVDAAEHKVKILFQVLDPANLGVPNLQDADFEVYENGELIGVESQANFSPQQIPFSINTVLLLDISSSVQDNITQIKEACSLLIDKKHSNQHFAIYVFDKNTRLLQDFTNDTNVLKNAINSISDQELESSTNLYGAIIETLGYIDIHYGIDYIEDGNIMVFTDGRHNSDPTITLAQTKAAVKESDINVFFAALQSPDLREDPLKEIASSSPTGKYFLSEDAEKLKETFVSIQQNIIDLSNSLYFLTYTSPIRNPMSRDNSLKIKLKGECGEINTTFDSEGFQK